MAANILISVPNSCTKIFKAPFLVQCFSYHTLIIFLMMISVILLITVIILSTVGAIYWVSDLWQQTELASELEIWPTLCETVDWYSNQLVVSVLWSLNLFHLTVSMSEGLGSINKKLLSYLADFGHSGSRGFRWIHQKRKICDNFLFHKILSKVSKNCKKW